MTDQKLHLSLFDLVLPLCKVVDIMSAEVADHHLKVAYLSYRLAEKMGLDPHRSAQVATAGILHDIGAFSLKERIDLLEFEDTHPGEHSMAGYLLLRDFAPFSNIAEMIRFHHVPWENGKGSLVDGTRVPAESHLLHLADRVAVRLPKDRGVLARLPDIRNAILDAHHSAFMPGHVEALLTLFPKDYIWLEATSGSLDRILQRIVSPAWALIDTNDLIQFSRLVCRLIDFKSEFTATHSSGVAATATALSRLAGFTEKDQQLMKVAAYLHDLGKLGIPSEIIEKPGALSEEEWHIMRSHVFYTYQVLTSAAILGQASAWSALHQERLNGKGYPFGYDGKDLTLGSRIMAVADIFTALTENRPYRKAMEKEKAAGVLRSMASGGEIDEELVRMVLDHFDAMNALRESAQKEAARQYLEFRKELSAA